MLNNRAFREEGSYNDGDGRRAAEASHIMGYAFVDTLVEVSESVDDVNKMNVTVTMEHVRVVPFY